MSNAVDAFVAAAKAGANPRLGPNRPGPDARRGRLIFALDATGSRQPTWDLASSLTYEMFREVAGLDVQLCYYRGPDEFRAFDWVSDPGRLVRFMGAIRCESGATQIGRALEHTRIENAKRKVGALVFVGDALERIHDSPEALRATAGSLGVPAFMFQEGGDSVVEAAFRDVAAASGGAWARFQPGAARELSAMLKAVAVYAMGGIKALAGRSDPASALLLTQMKSRN
jgi:hypothetical protein